ncbi:DUF2958 domain-containing protein [Paraburkholderia caledonica]
MRWLVHLCLRTKARRRFGGSVLRRRSASVHPRFRGGSGHDLATCHHRRTRPAVGQHLDALPVVRLFTPDAHLFWLLVQPAARYPTQCSLSGLHSCRIQTISAPR